MKLAKVLALSVLSVAALCHLAVAEQLTQLPGVYFTESTQESLVSVSRIEPDTQSYFQVGDTLRTYAATGENIGSISELREILNREQGYGTSQLFFHVDRDDMAWVIDVTLP
ncbi:hypothetical protein SLH49_06685 [Cognatiyoonia sp. IB215446]|uniref:hypothetical protein n=1 Tax=Cognatiyoonia sp. IB215446 TaxID=3097355 RepID=UPI002A155A1C|nr:hypothetical protein [Cognatiyoonia sp. IB215446]MDX8347668.1 hypothetical protein [Cognatiyoonia sp. IB215446]